MDRLTDITTRVKSTLRTLFQKQQCLKLPIASRKKVLELRFVASNKKVLEMVAEKLR